MPQLRGNEPILWLKKIEDGISTRKKNRGQINKQKKPPLDALEHRMRRKERHASKALKTWAN